MALRTVIGNPFRPLLDSSKWHIQQARGPEAGAELVIEPAPGAGAGAGQSGSLSLIDTRKDSLPAPDDVALMIGSGVVAAAEIVGDHLPVYEDSAGRFTLTHSGEVVALSHTSALELAEWRARAPGRPASFSLPIFAAVEERAAELVRQMAGRSLGQARLEAPSLRPPTRLAQSLAERLFPRGLAAQLAHAAAQVNASLLFTLRVEDGLMFGLRGPVSIGLYLQPEATAEGSYGLSASTDVAGLDPQGAVSGPLRVLMQVLCGAPEALLSPRGSAMVGESRRRAGGMEGKSVFGTESEPSKDLLLSPATVELNGWPTQILLRRSDRGFVGFAGLAELTVRTQPTPTWPIDLPVILHEAAAAAPSYAVALLTALNPGLRDRLLSTALAATVSLLQPRYYGPLCNFSRIEEGRFVPLGVDGAWVRFAPSDASRLHFRFVAGLADARDVSIESLGAPTLYLRRLQSRLLPCPLEDDSEFRVAATFHLVRGLANPRGVSLRTHENPPRYVVATNVAGDEAQGTLEVLDFYFLGLEHEKNDPGFRESATFFLETALRPPPQESAVLRLGERLLIGENRRSGNGRYYLSLSPSGVLSVVSGSGPGDTRGNTWSSSGGATGFYSARMEPGGILQVVREAPLSAQSNAATLALSEETVVFRTEVHGEPGDCFAAVLGSGELGVFRGTPEEPGELVWSSRRGALHWARRRTPVAVTTPHGLLTVRAEEGGVRTDAVSLGKHQSLELWELWDGRVALRALDRSFLSVYSDAAGGRHLGARTTILSPEAIFSRQGNSTTQTLRSFDGHAVAERDGQLVLGDVAVPLRISELPFHLPPRTGRTVELSSARSGLLLTVEQRSLDDGAKVVLRPRTGFAEQVFRLIYQSADDTYAIVPVHSAKCLGIAGGSNNVGATLIQATPSGHPSQRFRLRPDSDGTWLLSAQHSGQLLGVPETPASPAAAPASGPPIEQRGVLSANGALPDRAHDSRFRMRPTRLLNDRALALDLSVGHAPAAVVYRESRGESPQFDSLLAAGNLQLVGDFGALGRSQLLCINRSTNVGPKLRLYDLSTGHPPCGEVLREDWGDYDWLNGWVDANDWYLVGDFMGLGHDQLVLMNRGGSLGRVMIADLATGYPVQIRYWESWGQSMWLDGWQDDGDVHLAGDFLGLGYDQWLTINRGGQHGRIRISDVKTGQARHLYVENYGDSPVFNGWLDSGDVILAGDFLHRGYDQLLCCDRSNGAGGLLIASFQGKKRAPADVLYTDTWQAGSAFSSWFDAGDAQLVGDFGGLGHDQLLLINRSQVAGGKLLVTDLVRGRPPSETRYYEEWGQSLISDGFGEMSDIVVAGDFAGRGWSQVLFLKRR